MHPDFFAENSVMCILYNCYLKFISVQNPYIKKEKRIKL